MNKTALDTRDSLYEDGVSQVGAELRMLSAVPDLVPNVARVQVLGRVAVHYTADESNRLTGSGQRLLAVLVAAGRDGATAERIAEEIWGDTQPNPWRPALRMAVARLRKQLPETWDVVADGGSYRIMTGDGWIDAWQLDTVASAQTPIAEDDLVWMLAGQPFGDVDLLEMVASSTQHLRMLQISVAERFCAQTPTSVSTATCSVLTSLIREHAYNDRLAVVIAQTLAASDRRTEAILALTAFAETYTSEFGVVPPDVNRFLSMTSDPGRGQSDGSLPSYAPALGRAEDIAKELRHLIEVPLLGRAEELQALRDSRGALVTGATGSGKSRLLAELVATDPSIATTYIVGDDRLDLPLGPFAAAMPDLRDELLSTDFAIQGRDEGSIERALSTRAWRIVLAHLEARSTERPQRLIVDDAHMLDPVSLGLVRLLVRSNTTADLVFVVCGRNDSDDVEWIDLVRDAERAGLDPIELNGLDRDELELMVFAEFPEATLQARQGLALDVYEASGGLPAVAGPLIAAADPETLALPEELAGASALARVTATFTERSPEVVAGAAVLGYQFSIGALIALTELDETVVFRVLDELWSSGMIVETDDPDQVRFRHVLVQRAFLDSVPLFRRGQLHRRAAEFTTDPHQRADHHANASALVPMTVAAESLLHSARLYAERRMWRKVSRELRRVDELSSDLLDAEALTLWAAALDQSGADGSACRQAAYQLSAEARDWDGALAAALSGLPEAELPDGDPVRIKMLAGIPADQLATGERFRLVFNLSRQLSLSGEYDESRKYADEALAVANDPDEVALSHVLRWIATRHSAKAAHTIPDDVGRDGSPLILTRIAQVRAINLAERGDFEGARVQAERFHELAIQTGDPLRLWHAQGLQGMFLLNDADFEGAEEMALKNMQFAELHDMQQGVATYFGQQLYSYDLRDRLSELAATLETVRSNLSGLVLGRAALILGRHASGNLDIGEDLRELLTESHDRDGSTFSLLAQVLLARFVLAYTPDLVPQVRSVLERYGDNPILAGFGAGSFGPTTRYVAQLSDDRTEQIALVEQSIEAADRHGPLLWRVHTRLDRAALGSALAMAEAEQLAAGTQLAPVVERRASQSS